MDNRTTVAQRYQGTLQPTRKTWIASAWAGRTAYSFFDQACFSGSMLVLNVVLARSVSPDEYGSFAVLFALFLILAGIHNAIIIEPMTVYGSQKSADELPKFLSQVYVLHGIVVIAISAIASAIAFSISAEILSDAKWTLALTTPMALCFWTVRRAYYIVGRPDRASAISATYALIVVGGMLLLNLKGALSAYSAFLLFGISGLFVSIIPAGRLFRSTGLPTPKTLESLLRKHWKYGKWALSESLMFALGTSLYPLLIAFFGGIAEAGVFRAVQVVFLPLTHVLIALGLLLLPWLARSRLTADPTRFSKDALRVVVAFFGISVIYVLPLLVFGKVIISALYGNPEYLELSWIIPYLGATSVLAAISTACMIGLRAIERPKLIFMSTAVSTSVTLAIGVPLVAQMGSFGLALALVLSTASGTLVLMWATRSFIQKLMVEENEGEAIGVIQDV